MCYTCTLEYDYKSMIMRVDDEGNDRGDGAFDDSEWF